jgi:hypothetical protein
MPIALVLLAPYLVFGLYLTFAGADVARTLRMLGIAALRSSLSALAIGAVVALFSAEAGGQAFVATAAIVSLVLLPRASLPLARDFAIPSGSAFEVVCLNALVLVVGSPPASFPLLDAVLGLAFRLLLNPFAALLPSWLAFALSLWPAAAALVLAELGERAPRSLRVVLSFWLLAMRVVVVLPAAIGTLLAFHVSSPPWYVDALFACSSLIYVVLAYLALRGTGAARALADRMDAGRRPPWLYAVAGIVTYAATSVSMVAFLDPQTATLVGFTSIACVNALLERSVPARAASSPRSLGLSAGPSAALLCAALLLLRPVADAMVEQRQRDVYSVDRAERHRPEHMRPVGADGRLCELETDGERERVHCPHQIWYPDPTRQQERGLRPIRWQADQARDFALTFGRREIRCAEIPARIRLADGGEGDGVLLLVYLPGAITGHGYGWVVERDASCSRVVELVRSRLVGLPRGFGYLWSPETAAARRETVTWLGELLDSPEPR